MSQGYCTYKSVFILILIFLISSCVLKAEASSSNLQFFHFNKNHSESTRSDTLMNGAYFYTIFDGHAFEIEHDQYTSDGARVQQDSVFSYSNYLVPNWKWHFGAHHVNLIGLRNNSKAVFTGAQYTRKNKWGYATWYLGADVSYCRDRTTFTPFNYSQLSPYGRIYRPGMKEGEFWYFDARIYWQQFSTAVLNIKSGQIYELGLAYSSSRWLTEIYVLPAGTTVNLIKSSGFVMNSDAADGRVAKHSWNISQTYNITRNMYLKLKYSKQYRDDIAGLRTDQSSIGTFLGFNF